MYEYTCAYVTMKIPHAQFLSLLRDEVTTTTVYLRYGLCLLRLRECVKQKVERNIYIFQCHKCSSLQNLLSDLWSLNSQCEQWMYSRKLYYGDIPPGFTSYPDFPTVLHKILVSVIWICLCFESFRSCPHVCLHWPYVKIIFSWKISLWYNFWRILNSIINSLLISTICKLAFFSSCLELIICKIIQLNSFVHLLCHIPEQQAI